jgi:diacylglycerol kinase family enzyme
MQRKLLYIVNPISGTRNKQSLEEIIKAETKQAGFPYAIYPSVANGDYSFLYPVIREQKFTDVIIAGGDGTINQAVNSLRKQAVQFGIIPCGSGNGLAFSAGIPKDPVKALHIAFNGQSKLTDAFFINKQFACMLCGLGFDAQVAHDFANSPKRGWQPMLKKQCRIFLARRPTRLPSSQAKRKFIPKPFLFRWPTATSLATTLPLHPKLPLLMACWM